MNLTATALFPYAFNNWNGTDNNSVNPTSVTMGTDKSVTASLTRLSPGTLQTKTGGYLGWEVRIPIQLGIGQWVQGGIISDRVLPWRILDPSFNIVRGLGSESQASFTFQAQTTGTYYIDIAYTSTIFTTNYTVTYTIYS